MRRDFKL